jgi:hypothetical protein
MQAYSLVYSFKRNKKMPLFTLGSKANTYGTDTLYKAPSSSQIWLPTLHPSLFKIWSVPLNGGKVIATPEGLCENGTTRWKIEITTRDNVQVQTYVNLNQQFTSAHFAQGSVAKTELMKKIASSKLLISRMSAGERSPLPNGQKPRLHPVGAEPKPLFVADAQKVTLTTKELPNGMGTYQEYVPVNINNKDHVKAAREANQHDAIVATDTAYGIGKGVVKAGIGTIKSVLELGYGVGHHSVGRVIDKLTGNIEGLTQKSKERDALVKGIEYAVAHKRETVNAMLIRPISEPLAAIPGQIARQDYVGSGESLGTVGFNIYVSVKGGIGTFKTVGKLNSALAWKNMSYMQRKAALLKMPEAKGLTPQAAHILAHRSFMSAKVIAAFVKTPTVRVIGGASGGVGEAVVGNSVGANKQLTVKVAQLKPDAAKVEQVLPAATTPILQKRGRVIARPKQLPVKMPPLEIFENVISVNNKNQTFRRVLKGKLSKLRQSGNVNTARKLHKLAGIDAYIRKLNDVAKYAEAHPDRYTQRYLAECSNDLAVFIFQLEQKFNNISPEITRLKNTETNLSNIYHKIAHNKEKIPHDLDFNNIRHFPKNLVGAEFNDGGLKSIHHVFGEENEATVIARMKFYKFGELLKDEAGMLQTLRKIKLPVIGKSEIVALDGNALDLGMLLQKAPKGSLHSKGNFSAAQWDAIINKTTLANLKYIQKIVIKENINIDDFQFFIFPKGIIKINDPLYLYNGVSTDNLNMLNKLIITVENDLARIAKTGKRTSKERHSLYYYLHEGKPEHTVKALPVERPVLRKLEVAK